MYAPLLALLFGLLASGTPATPGLSDDPAGYHGTPRGSLQAPVILPWKLYRPYPHEGWTRWHRDSFGSAGECQDELEYEPPGAYCEKSLDST